MLLVLCLSTLLFRVYRYIVSSVSCCHSHRAVPARVEKAEVTKLETQLHHSSR